MRTQSPDPGGRGLLALGNLRARLRGRRQRTLDLFTLDILVRHSEARIVYGNRLRLLVSGREAFSALESSIASARSTLSFEMYLWRNDRLGRRVAALVAGRARAGVHVRIVYDAFGCLGQEGVFRPIVEAGGEVVPYRPVPWIIGRIWPGRRDHRKLAIVDGREAFVGSRNVGEEYSEEFAGQTAFRDLTVSIEGPAVRECERLFLRIWLRHGPGSRRSAAPTAGPGSERRLNTNAGLRRADLLAEAPVLPNVGRAGVQVVGSRGLRGRRVMRDSLVAMLRVARRDVIFAHAYFFPDHGTLHALRSAARRGVRVQVLLPAFSDVPIAREAGRAFYGRLLKSGIEVRERLHRMLHMKAGIVDGEAVIMGSANLDTLSLLKNREISVNLFDRQLAADLRAALAEDLAASRRVTLEEWERRGGLRRLLERLSANLRAWY